MRRLKQKIKQLLDFDNKVNAEVKRLMKRHEYLSINDTRDQDVFIAGFPKSGNTWMQNLITGILLDSTSFRITPKIVSEIVPDVHAKKYYKRTRPDMIFKTHNLPDERMKRVIHLVRDGRDAMISYHKMEVNRDRNYKFSIEDMIKGGKGVYPAKWNVHTKAWIENPFNADLMVIKYEDLLNESLTEMIKIAKFLNIEMSEKRLAEIYEANHISILRKKVVEYGWDYDYVYKNKTSESFFRKGTSGSHESEIDANLTSYFVNESKAELNHFGYI